MWRGVFQVTNTVRQSRRFGIIGSVVGLLALLASALTQLLPASHLSRPIVGQAAEEAGPRSRDHLIFRTKRLEIRSREASEPRAADTSWNDVLSTAAASLGVLAIAFAVIAVILREEKLLAGVAAVLGVAAIAVQVWWALIVVALAMIIISAFLNT
jgi:ABC-type multidrug transport system fused ATPase/permease subunit